MSLLFRDVVGLISLEDHLTDSAIHHRLFGRRRFEPLDSENARSREIKGRLEIESIPKNASLNKVVKPIEKAK